MTPRMAAFPKPCNPQKTTRLIIDERWRSCVFPVATNQDEMDWRLLVDMVMRLREFSDRYGCAGVIWMRGAEDVTFLSRRRRMWERDDCPTVLNHQDIQPP